MYTSFDVAILLLEMHTKEIIKGVLEVHVQRCTSKHWLLCKEKGRKFCVPKVGDWLCKVWSIHTVGHYAAVENKDGSICLPTGLLDYIKPHRYTLSAPCTLYSLQLLLLHNICICVLI